MKIIVIGGTGILGKELKKIDESLICIGSEYDIYNFIDLKIFLDSENPDIIINCVAIKSDKVNIEPINSININIIGSCNLSKYCINNNKRLVYISTDYVYSGKKGNYSENDPILPHNDYAWTKLGGETPVKLVKNHLIIRTSFGENLFPYKNAYKNLFTSKDYVDIIAPLVLDKSKSNITGTINVGTNRKSVYDYAIKKNIVFPIFLEKKLDFSFKL
jgi:dTDP-4-dehydrorhamnose reductase